MRSFTAILKHLDGLYFAVISAAEIRPYTWKIQIAVSMDLDYSKCEQF